MDSAFPMALPKDSVLAGQYIIDKTLGQGGFGITYRAIDYKSNSYVAIKEFYPETMATREGITVVPFSGEASQNYYYGMEQFLDEAKTLSEFIGNPNIVKVHRYFEENGTAYFAMDFVEGESFDKYLKKRGGKISYREAERILLHVVDALAAVHSKGIVHRDVTPDNIYITSTEDVRLLDFGAARYSLGDRSRSLDVVLKHGFAPKEQYSRHGRQGAFTDVYSLGATMYYAITGVRPPDSIERLDEDKLILPSQLGVTITQSQEMALMKAMSVRAETRFQDMIEFKNALLQSAPQYDGPVEFCINCGQMIKAKSKFCPICGFTLDENTAKAQNSLSNAKPQSSANKIMGSIKNILNKKLF